MEPTAQEETMDDSKGLTPGRVDELVLANRVLRSHRRTVNVLFATQYRRVVS